MSGLHPNTITRWVAEGVIRPASGGGRQGTARMWSVMHAIALTAGAAYRDEQASPARVAGVVRFLSGLRPDVFEKDLAEGRTFPCPSELMGVEWVPGMMIEPPLNDPKLSPAVRMMIHKLDLQRIRDRVLDKIAKLKNNETITAES